MIAYTTVLVLKFGHVGSDSISMSRSTINLEKFGEQELEFQEVAIAVSLFHPSKGLLPYNDYVKKHITIEFWQIDYQIAKAIFDKEKYPAKMCHSKDFKNKDQLAAFE